MARDTHETAEPLDAAAYPADVEPLSPDGIPLHMPPLPKTQAQLLAMARQRLPALRAELEFWQKVLANAGTSSGSPRR
jgi:hypothetical protein